MSSQIEFYQRHEAALQDGSTEAARRQRAIEEKYAGYISSQKKEIAKNQEYENAPLPPNLQYHTIQGLSSELCSKLTAMRPDSLGHAGRIPGMTPAAISVLRVYLKRCGMLRSA